MKLYYAQEMPYVVAQPVLTRDVLSSLLAKNDSEVAAQQEWEAEWNQAGLASRLSESVREERRERGRKGEREGRGREREREGGVDYAAVLSY